MPELRLAEAPAQGPESAPSGRLRLVNLLNDLPTLGSLLLAELRRDSWLDAYLLAVGMGQVVDDELLQPDRHRLDLVAEGMRRRGHPAVDRGLARLRTAAALGRERSLRGALAWRAGLASLVDELAAAMVADGRALSPAGLKELGGALVVRAAEPPLSELNGLVRLPSCFRSFDQHPDDIGLLTQELTGRWPDRTRPLLVVGVRTSGSYLAPLTAAWLRRCGFGDVGVLTVRPGRPLLAGERRALRSLGRRGGLVVLTDDPPDTGEALAGTARQIEGLGVGRGSLVLMLQLLAGQRRLPPPLLSYPAALLPWERWAVHGRLTTRAVGAALAVLVGPTVSVEAVGRLPAPAPANPRGHVRARFRARLLEHGSGRAHDEEVMVEGVGLGYLGAHTLAVAQALGDRLPRVHGLVDGLLYRAWVPDAHRVAPAGAGGAAAGIAAYVVSRRRALAVPADPTLRLSAGQTPVWEAASHLLSQAFGRAWPLVRLPIVDPAMRRLLAARRPAVIDGATGIGSWFHALDGDLVKVGFAERAFSSDDLACFDPAYDLAVAAASVPDPGFGDQLREAYAALDGEAIDEERWLVYQLVWLWSAARRDPARREAARRASARALGAYFSRRYLRGLAVDPAGPLCALDIDGVLEGTALGYPALTPAAATALRSLICHGYRPLLASGRSRADVVERCRLYGLPGGVAEYGAVAHDARGGRTLTLSSPQDDADLRRLRATLDGLPGVRLDPDYRHSVRAYRERGGTRTGLRREEVEAALGSAPRERLRAIQGEDQTDFVARGTDKAAGLGALIEVIGRGRGPAGARPLALAVGDGEADVGMFELAEVAACPASADRAARRSRARRMRAPYQAGLAQAVVGVLGHRPGGCLACRPPDGLEKPHLVREILAASERGRWGLVRAALRVRAAGREP